MIYIIGDAGSNHLKKYCKYLTDLDVSFRILPTEPNIDNYLFVAIDVLKKLIQLIRLVNRKDVVHIHYIGKYAILGILLSFFGSRVVYTAWGSDILLAEGRFQKFVIKMCVSKSVAVLGDSKRIKSSLEHLSKKVNFHFYEFGVPIEFKQTTSSINMDLINPVIQWLKGCTEILVSVRRHEKIYNIPLIIESFVNLLKFKPHAKLIVMGSGSMSNELRRDCAYYSDKIYFFGEYNCNELISILHLNPVIISAAISDSGLSSTVAECMTFGSLCVLSDVADNREWVDEDHRELLFSLNTESVVNSILYCLNMPKLSRAIIINKQRERILKCSNGLESTRLVVNKIYYDK